jgi:hypothetical protein
VPIIREPRTRKSVREKEKWLDLKFSDQARCFFRYINVILYKIHFMVTTSLRGSARTVKGLHLVRKSRRPGGRLALRGVATTPNPLF